MEKTWDRGYEETRAVGKSRGRSGGCPGRKNRAPMRPKSFEKPKEKYESTRFSEKA